MTYQPPNTGPQQQPPYGYPPPSAGGPGQLPHPAAPPWPATPPPPSRRRRRAMLIAVVAAILVGAGVLTTVLTTGGASTSRFVGAAGSSSAAPTATSHAPNPGGTTPNGSRPLPPPTPTGQPYDNDDPQPGDCADLARRPTGTVIYHATCDDPAATLILDRVLAENEKCPGTGFFGLKTLSKRAMCFTYNFHVGDCVDMQIRRRIACADPAATTGGKSATVSEIRLGQQDGTGCVDPEFILQVGKGKERGVACLADSTPNTPPKTSR